LEEPCCADHAIATARSGIVAPMKKTQWPVAGLVGLLACGGNDGPTPAPFGLDKRPSNTTCLASSRPVIDTGVTLQQMWAGLNFQQPIYLTQAPGDDTTWYVVRRSGEIWSFQQDGTNYKLFVSVDVNAQGEGGLLGFAFHPEWPNRPEAYLSYTRNAVGGDPSPPSTCGATSMLTSVVSRFQSTDGGQSLDDDGDPDEILRLRQPFANHNGGTIQFGPDGMLYFGLGDGGNADDRCEAGQNMGTLLGKILRVDVNAPAGSYQVPPDNPFVGTTGARPEIWAYGFRNPWRWSFDRASGELWLGDVGQGAWEEIDRVVKGGNYGWKICEGFHRRGSTTAMCNTPGMIDPIVAHPRAEAASITGGYVYHGSAMPSLAGTYIYGDYVTGNIWALLYDADNKPAPRQIAMVAPQTLVSFAQGNDGEIYTVQISGIISKLVPAGPPPPDDFPKLLSATGCVDPGDPTKPAPGLIPYEVNAQLWSDGADKERWFAIPDGATIAIGPDDDWDLPVGSVAVKTFSVGGKRIETRLFMRHEDGGWGGYTYEWDEAQTEATLLAAGKLRTLGATQAWGYPSRSQCLQCHSRAAGGTLGFETAQMNRDAVYPSTNRRSNQLATLDHIGMLSAPLPVPPADAVRLPDPAGKDELEARARAYLHANCSHCHRPEGGAQGMMDLRFAKSLRDTATCNADNAQGPIAGATKLIAPGAPGSSILSLRVHATDAKRMPPVAVTVLDPVGSAVIDDWITSLTACP
jgi:uncharacterized repeat protein (TIGR03806 family)